MVTLELLVDYTELVAQVEPIRAIAGWVIPAIAGASALVNLGSSIKAGRDSAKANQSAEAAMQQQQQANEAWYQQRMNENYLDTAEAQAALTKAREMAQEQMATARGMQTVMGGTDASIAATQQSVNKMLADTTSGLAATGSARKDSYEQTYMNRNNELSRQLIDYYGQKAANSAAAGSGALNALGGIGSSLITALSGK